MTILKNNLTDKKEYSILELLDAIKSKRMFVKTTLYTEDGITTRAIIEQSVRIKDCHTHITEDEKE